MTPLQGCSRRNQWKNKPGILLAIVVIASSSVLISVPSPALAVTSGTAKSSTVFGGYVKGLRRAKERAQANFTVPTVTCDEGSNQALLITQDLNFDRGEYVEAEVVAECNSGTATYSAEAVQCGIDGCNPSMFGPGCAMPEPVSPGDSITLSETNSFSSESWAISEFRDHTNGNEASCSEVETFPEIPGPVETGMCPTVNVPDLSVPSSATSLPQNCGIAGGVPNVTPITFTGVTADGRALSFQKPRPNRFGPTHRYDYVNGKTKELTTSKLIDNGESFTMSYV